MGALHAIFSFALATSAIVEELPDFPRATQLYRDNEFEEALVAFQKAALDPGATDADLAVIHVWLGLCRAGLGDGAATRTEFAAALKLDKQVVMPAFAAPKMHALF